MLDNEATDWMVHMIIGNYIISSYGQIQNDRKKYLQFV